MSIVGKKHFSNAEKMKFVTNKFNLPFEAVVELIHINSNHDSSLDLSASGMTRTVKQIIFEYRYPELALARDVMDTLTLAGAQGNARHMWAEDAWQNPATVKAAMNLCGVNDSAVERIRINPEKVETGTIPVFIEHSFTPKVVNGMTVGGTADLIFNGMIEDYKTVSPWTRKYSSTIQGYVMQMSVYRWLNPDLVTSAQGKLNFRYPKWDERDTKMNGYPKFPVESIIYDLYPVEVVQDFVEKQTKLILESIDKPDDALPPCPSQRLEQNKVWKIFTEYDQYAQGKASRRTVYSLDEALIAMKSIKTGVLLEITGKPSLCKFCAFTTVCSQHALINKESVRILKEW